MVLLIPLALLLAGYNNVTNLALPAQLWRRHYVPLNVGLAAALVWLGRSTLSWRALGLGVEQLAEGLLWGSLAGALVAMTVIQSSRWIPLVRDFADHHVDGLSRSGLLFYVFVRIPLGTALLEEVAFRGVLFGVWASVFGPVSALVGTSVIFGIWHIGPTLQALRATRVRAARRPLWVAFGVLSTAVAGLVFGWLRMMSGGVWAPLLVHATLNGVSASMAWVRSSRADVAEA